MDRNNTKVVSNNGRTRKTKRAQSLDVICRASGRVYREMRGISEKASQISKQTECNGGAVMQMSKNLKHRWSQQEGAMRENNNLLYRISGEDSHTRKKITFLFDLLKIPIAHICFKTLQLVWNVGKRIFSIPEPYHFPNQFPPKEQYMFQPFTFTKVLAEHEKEKQLPYIHLFHFSLYQNIFLSHPEQAADKAPKPTSILTRFYVPSRGGRNITWSGSNYKSQSCVAISIYFTQWWVVTRLDFIWKIQSKQLKIKHSISFRNAGMFSRTERQHFSPSKFTTAELESLAGEAIKISANAFDVSCG